MRAWMFLPLISGCFGVYAEVAATTYPSASLGSAGGSTSASSVGFNVGVDFGNLKWRQAKLPKEALPRAVLLGVILELSVGFMLAFFQAWFYWSPK